MNRFFSLTSLVLASVPLATGCVLIESVSTDPTATDPTPDDDPAGTAQVRFVNVNPDTTVTVSVDSNDDLVADAESELDFFAGTDWMEIPAGTGAVTIVDDAGSLLAETTFTFEKDQKYSVGTTNQPGAWIKLYQADGVGDNDTRVNLRNAYQGGPVDATISTWQDDQGQFVEDHAFSYDANGEWVEDLPFVAAAVQLRQTYADQDDLQVDWNIAALVQVDPGSVMDAYTVLEGDCSAWSTSCQPWLVAHQADGSTFTVETEHTWPTVDDDGDGSPANEDCDDSDPFNFPGNLEVCDGYDNDCDGDVGGAFEFELNSSAAYTTTASGYAHMSFVVQPDVDVTIDTFEAYMGGSGTAGIALYSRSDASEPWGLVASQGADIGGLDWYGGSGLGWVLTGGTEYMLTYGVTGTYTYTLVTTLEDPEWGTYKGYANVGDAELSPSTLEASPNSGISTGFRLVTDC